MGWAVPNMVEYYHRRPFQRCHSEAQPRAGCEAHEKSLTRLYRPRFTIKHSKAANQILFSRLNSAILYNLGALRRIFSILGTLCAMGSIFNTPYTHIHALDDNDHQPVIHSHFALHIAELEPNSGPAFQAQHPEARYLDFFGTQTDRISGTLSLAVAPANVLQPAVRVVGAALSSEACAHGPPVLRHIPARSPPASARSFLA